MQTLASELSALKLVIGVLLACFLLGVALVTASAQSQPQGPPAFVTLPRHPAIEGASPGQDHPLPFRLELRNEMFEMVGGLAPGGGGSNGGGKNGGGLADFGQNAAVAMVSVCFPSSADNFDASCAETSYQGEPMLAANTLLSRLMGSSNDIYPGKCSVSAAPGTFGDCGAAALVSTNGVAWERFKLTRTWGGHNFLVGFDTSAAVDSLGRAFLAYGVYDPSTGANGVVAVSSIDGGLTWTKTNPVVLHSTLTAFEDKYWVAADANPSSSFKDRLYVAWDSNVPCGFSCVNQVLLVSSSSDQGKTWTTPVKINDGTSSSERVIYAFPAVAPDGTVYVLWHDYARQIIFMDKSADGGNSWGTDVAVASTNIGFGVDAFSGFFCNGGRVATPAPQMAIDSAGNVYVVFVKDGKPGKQVNLDVFVTKSTDRGATWSQPQRVGSTGTGHQYNPAIAIDSLGGISVSYLDRRDDPNNCRTNTYLSHSTDGGATFTDSKVTDVDSDFDGNKNGPGDYSGLACWGPTAYAFFSDHRDANTANDTTTGFIAGGFEIYAGRKP
jgi:hypothetical protein